MQNPNEYLITIYPENFDPKAGDEPDYKVVYEEGLFDFLRNNVCELKFTVSKLELLLDLS